MCVFKTLLCALALVTFAQPAGEVRDNDALLRKVTDELRGREPAMRQTEHARYLLDGGGPVESNKVRPEAAFQSWKGAGGESVVFFLFIEDTPEKATEGYRKSKLPYVGLGVSRAPLDTKVEGVGEEAHAWRGEYSAGHGITFRKGRFTADVEALSLETARRFASHIAAVLPSR